MPAVEERVYDFRTAAHWRAGVRRGLQVRGDRLVVPDALTVRPVGGTGRADGGALPAAGGCAGLTWLRPRSRELVRLLDQEQAVAELGVLEGLAPARRLVVERSLLWVLAGDDLERHDARTLQRLTPAAVPTGWRVSDVTGDGADGVWVVEVGAGGRRLRHVDCWGRTCRDTIALDRTDGPDSGPAADAGADTSDPAVGDRAELSLAAGATAAWIAVVDPDASTELLVVDTSTAAVTRIPLDPVHRRGRTLLAADTVVHLLTVADDRSAGVVYQSLDARTGDVEDHQVLTLPRGLGRPTSLAVEGTTLVLGGSGGLAHIIAAPATEPRRATFITPTLVSPLGPVAPWDRAEVDVVLPAGTTMEISWATGEPSLAASLLDGRSPAGALDELEEVLSWRRGATYRGSTDAPERLVDLLDGADGTTLWLRVQLAVPAGGPAPELARLRVRYPSTSYLDHLPAIYREDPRGADELRRLLAPYEVLLDGIDETLDTLPARLDPATADDGWSDYLLGWLGFPPLGELPAHVRRDLLVRAAEILDLRGTRTGLELVLDLVTGGRASVEDSADEPAGWFLGAHAAPSVGAEPARLGADTVALGQLPRPPRAGALVLGAARLGPTCADPAAMLAQRARTVRITLAVGPDRSELEPLLGRLLDVFVPAHCRVEVRWTGAAGGRRLGGGLRLAGGPGDGTEGAVLADSDDSRLAGADHLGATTRLGRWPLPATADAPIVLDHAARLGPGPRLQ
jgi:phage tail-like protein